MSEIGVMTILAVDDEPSILEALKRLLRPDGIEVRTAGGGEEALRVLETDADSIGAIISDYSMPGMTGAQLLAITYERWPDLTRVLLTGNADLEAASRAVNEGKLSSLYMKPWQPTEFRQAVVHALDQHRMITENRKLRALAEEQAVHLEQWNQRLETQVAERTAELEQANAGLQKGLLATVQLLIGMLEQRLPERAAQCREVARLTARLAERAGLPKPEIRWVQVAALIHDLGLTSLPDTLLRRPPAELMLSQRQQYERHPLIGQKMLSWVDELSQIGIWVRHHHERWDGQGYPDRLVGEAIPLPSQLIGLADAYLEAASIGSGTAPMWRHHQVTAGAFDPGLVGLLHAEVSGEPMRAAADEGERPAAFVETPTISLNIEYLREGMILAQAITTTAGAVLLQEGETLTHEHLARIHSLTDKAILTTKLVLIERTETD